MPKASNCLHVEYGQSLRGNTIITMDVDDPKTLCTELTYKTGTLTLLISR
ncbi:hypothetical protein [Dubosiella newyorkensis]